MVCRVSDILDHQIVWIRELPELLMTGEKHQSFHQVIILPKDIKIIESCIHIQVFASIQKLHILFLQVVLRLLKRFAINCTLDPSLQQEFEYMQYSLQEFYSTCLDDGNY